MEINEFKYLRIQGRDIAQNTDYPNGIFGIFRDFEKYNVMTQEDQQLVDEVLDFFTNNLPMPSVCKEKKKNICYFKTENSEEMMRYMRPMMWLLERYNHPYDIILTNFPGKIIYEDEYQIVVTVEDLSYENEKDKIKEDIFKKLANGDHPE